MGTVQGPHHLEWDDWFPNNNREALYETSPCDRAYNCIAHAVGEKSRWWEPLKPADCYWPPDVPQEFTIGTLVLLFEKQGYEKCWSSCLQKGYEKIALYEVVEGDLKGDFSHVAYQLRNGEWTSKFGDFHDARHATPGCLVGPFYGAIHCYMKRKRRKS